jgi:hypothetical protein
VVRRNIIVNFCRLENVLPIYERREAYTFQNNGLETTLGKLVRK